MTEIEYNPRVTDPVAIVAILDRHFQGAGFELICGWRKAGGFVRHTIVDGSGQRVGWVNFQHDNFYNFRPFKNERNNLTWQLFAAHCDTYCALKEAWQWQQSCLELSEQLAENNKLLAKLSRRKWYHLLLNIESKEAE